MERSNYYVTLDVQQSRQGCLLDMHRGDTHRRLYIRLTDGGVPYPVDPEVFAVLTAKGADGTVLYNPCAVEDGGLRYDITAQTTAREGELDCQVKLYHSDGLVPVLPDGTVDTTAGNIRLLTSARFGIRIHSAVYNGQEPLAPQSEFSALEAAVAAANSVVRAYENGELKGEKGDKGDPGAQGEKGEKGDPGESGYTGGDLDMDGYDITQAHEIFCAGIEAGWATVTKKENGYDLGAIISPEPYEDGCAVLDFFGANNDELTILRHLAPGTGASDAVTKGQLDEAVGDVETALDAILAIQNELIGGEEA